MAINIEQGMLIEELRLGGKGYVYISNVLGIKRDQVRDYCRRKGNEHLLGAKGIKKCHSCGKEFINANNQKYCSDDCKHKAVEDKNSKRIRVCKCCEKEFNPKGKERFCSIECKQITQKEGTKTKAVNKCVTCGKQFESDNKKKYCSSKCLSMGRLKANNQRLIKRNCKCCRTEFETTTRKNEIYCGRSCMDIDRRKPHEQFVKELFDRHKGMIVPLETYKGNENKMVCLCLKCGRKSTKTGHNHLRGGCTCTKGGARDSKGSLLVEEFLVKHGYIFEKELTFIDLVSDTNSQLYYDFAVKENNEIKFLIEYDGRQHFEPVWGGEEELKRTQALDVLKNEYAKKRNIPLIRINYRTKDINKELKERIGNV